MGSYEIHLYINIIDETKLERKVWSMILIYKDTSIVSADTIKDIDLFIKNRSMFNNMTDTQIYNTHIINCESASMRYKYKINIFNKYMQLSNMEYDILNIHYSMDESIHNKYTLYQYIYTHPLLKIDNIDGYIKYRDMLDDMCYLDREYRDIVRTI